MLRKAKAECSKETCCNGRARCSDDCLVMQWQGDVLNSWVKQRQSPVSPSSAKARCGVAAKCAVMQRKGIERLSIVSNGKAELSRAEQCKAWFEMSVKATEKPCIVLQRQCEVWLSNGKGTHCRAME